jgi:hypothetical protein
MHLKDPTISPPGGPRFTHPDGFVSTGVNIPALTRKVAQYRANRSLPPVSEGFARLSQEVEAHICAAMTLEDQDAYCVGGHVPPKAIHWTEVKRFLLAMAAWALKGFRSVPQEEATRRAEICAGCPYNVGTSGCGACRSALLALRSSILKATTPYDDKLQACGVCGCDNPLQVHVPLDVLHKVRTGVVYPDHCWKRDLIAAD